MLVPVFLRSRGDLLEPFAEHGVFADLVVEHIVIGLTPDPVWDKYPASGNAAVFGQKWAKAFRVTMAPSLVSALDADQRPDFLGRLESGIAARFAAEPEPMPMWFARLFLAKSGKRRLNTGPS